MKNLKKLFVFLFILNLLTFSITAKADSRTGIGIIGYGDEYTPTRVISIVDSLTNNNRKGIYYEAYSSTIYLSVLALGTSVSKITVDQSTKPYTTTTLGGTTVYKLTGLSSGKHKITIVPSSTSSDYQSSSNYMYINIKPNVKVFTEKVGVPTYKNFDIKFNEPVKDDGKLPNYISISDLCGNEHNIRVSVISSDPCTIYVTCKGDYDSSKDYTLHILPGIKSTSGHTISEERVLRFRTVSSSLSGNLEIIKASTKPDITLDFE